jgi:hypothetical protein
VVQSVEGAFQVYKPYHPTLNLKLSGRKDLVKAQTPESRSSAYVYTMYVLVVPCYLMFRSSEHDMRSEHLKETETQPTNK